MRQTLLRLAMTALFLDACSATPVSADASSDGNVQTDVRPADVMTSRDVTLPDVFPFDATNDVPHAPDAVDIDAVNVDVQLTDTGSPQDAAPADVPWAEGVAPEGCMTMGGGLCFLRPSGAVQTNRGTLDLACRETAVEVTARASTAPVEVTNFVSGAPLARASVALSSDDLFTSVTTATSAEDGSALVQVPIGTPSRLNWRVTADGFFDTYSLAARIDVRMALHIQRVFAIPRIFAPIVYGSVGLAAQASGTGIVGGVIDDCNGQALENMVVTLSSTQSTIPGELNRWRAPTFVPGAKVFYFEGDAPPAPVPRSRRTHTSDNGLWVILDVPPTEGDTRWYLQAWGARVAGDVRLMGETRVRVIAGAVMLPEVQAWR